MTREPVFSETRHPTYKIVYPRRSSRDCERSIVGWWVFDPPEGCCTTPDPGELSLPGWLCTLLLALVFWPAACLPCCLSDCYEGYQIPVYSDRPQPPQPVVVVPIVVPPSAPPAPGEDTLPVAQAISV